MRSQHHAQAGNPLAGNQLAGNPLTGSLLVAHRWLVTDWQLPGTSPMTAGWSGAPGRWAAATAHRTARAPGERALQHVAAKEVPPGLKCCPGNSGAGAGRSEAQPGRLDGPDQSVRCCSPHVHSPVSLVSQAGRLAAKWQLSLVKWVRPDTTTGKMHTGKSRRSTCRAQSCSCLVLQRQCPCKEHPALLCSQLQPAALPTCRVGARLHRGAGIPPDSRCASVAVGGLQSTRCRRVSGSRPSTAGTCCQAAHTRRVARPLQQQARSQKACLSNDGKERGGCREQQRQQAVRAPGPRRCEHTY